LAFEILIRKQAAAEIDRLRVYDQKKIAAAIRAQLEHQPLLATRNRKCLSGVRPEFEHVPPVWQLRVGLYRVFYDVDEKLNQVHIRAVRRKEPTDRTKDIT
jgi:mRNA-degrading endonuclease RelE of RelBE toxin-antitoxin system